ncbi:MAG TPA: glycoside hydrolase family 95 protein [Clostridiales bacterium]|nr:glycoside hydrolase family 95 protein [Clostridiales bacterium]
MNINSHNLFYKEPANDWVEALAIGNGKLGGMCFCGTEYDKISLNHDELWSGFPRDTTNGVSYKTYEAARELAYQGKYIDAQNLLEKDFQGLNTNAYLPFGDLIIGHKKGEVKNYSRRLDLRNSLATCEYDLNDGKIKKTYFASFPENVIVVRVESENLLNFTISMQSELRFSTKSEKDTLVLDGTCFSASKNSIERTKNLVCELYSDKDEEHGIDFRGAVTVKADGAVQYFNDKIEITANEFTLYFSCESSFNGFDKHPYLEGKPYKDEAISYVKAAAEKEYEKLLAEHIADVTEIYDRVEFNISGESNDLIPTLDRFKGEPDNSLHELIFNFGRYLTIASSRPDSQCTNLQGIWNNKIDPPWQSNYTVNINTEMNYFPTLACNMAELQEPLNRFVKELSVAGQNTAKQFYNARGFCCHHNSDIWRHTVPVQGSACWSFWPMAGAWFCHNIFEYYEYTLDKKFLEETALPIMRGSVEFILDVLTPDKDGYLIFAPSTSPENKFFVGLNQSAVSLTTYMTMGIIRGLFTDFIKACDELGIADEDYISVKEKLPKLLPFRTDSKGRLLEWYEENKEVEPKHRHCSHLYALHPARLINPVETPELAEAAKKTLEARGDDGTGWSLGWKICFWARLFDGNHALKLLNMQLRLVSSKNIFYMSGGGTYPNLFDAHPPFQIDGNFAAPAGISEMLLQNIGDELYLLPALPDAWKDGSVKGLRAKGNITVDIEWQDKKVTDYTIHGDLGNIKVRKNG